MKESNILVGDVTIKQLQRVILLNTKGQYIKESYIPAGSATEMEVWFNTKGHIMMESSILAGNVTIKPLQIEVWLTYRSKTGVKYSFRQCDHQASSKGDIAQHKRVST